MIESTLSKLSRVYTWAERKDRYTMVHAFPRGVRRSLCGLVKRTGPTQWTTEFNGWTGWCGNCRRSAMRKEEASR